MGVCRIDRVQAQVWRSGGRIATGLQTDVRALTERWLACAAINDACQIAGSHSVHTVAYLGHAAVVIVVRIHRAACVMVAKASACLPDQLVAKLLPP
jgi:hypothetical protein